jgi:tetratricopeptide (TPR) repeat protein
MASEPTQSVHVDERLDELVAAFLEAGEAGQAPDRQQWLADYPELADFLADHEAVRCWTRPMAQALGTPVGGIKGPYLTIAGEAGRHGPAPAAVPTIDNYELLGEIASGGMGIVYRARQRSLNRIVAVKVLRNDAAASLADLQRFRSESETVAALDHPHIVPIYEVGLHDGQPFFSMKLIEGGSLAQHLPRFTADPSAAAPPLVELAARAVHHAHQRGILHRDLKPSNILLDAAGEPHITDFGLAKRVSADTSITQPGVIVGTPSYMAPEQAQGRKGLSVAADIYSLGAVLYALLTGQPPFQGESALDVLLAVIGNEPKRPRKINPQVAADLETICLKCLQKDPGQRYASAADLADDLRRYQKREPLQARPAGRWERALKWSRRHPAAALLAAVSVVAALGLFAGVLFYALYQDERARSAEQQLQQEVSERQRLGQVRSQAQAALLAGQDAGARQDWHGARLQLSRVLDLVGGASPLDDLKAPAARLLARADQKLAALAAREAAAQRYQRFQELRGRVLLHSSQVSGLDRDANLRICRQAAAEALALFGRSRAVSSPGTAALLPREKQELDEGYYELLLLLAEATAQPLPGEDPVRQAEQALRTLEQATQLRPPTRAYHLRRANYLTQRHDSEAAAQARRLAESLPPTAAVDHFLLGDERYQRRDLPQALQHFYDALVAEPRHFWAQFMAGVCYLQLQRHVEARIALTACQQARPDFVWIYLLRGFSHTELGAAGRPPAAALHFQAAEADFAKAKQLEHDTDAAYALLVNRGVLRLRQERAADALVDLGKAAALKPNQYQAYANLAAALAQRQQLDSAQAQLDKAIALRSDLATLYRSRARLHLKRQDRDAALADLERAIALESPNGTSRQLLAEDNKECGLILAQRKQYEEAVRAYDRALQFRPGYPVALRLRAEALLGLKRYAEVVAALDQYLVAAARNLDDYRKQGEPVADAYRARGLAQARLRNPAAALDDYARALDIDPNAETFAYRGWVHLVLEAPKLALRDFEKAVELDPESSDAHNGRGHARVLLGQVRDGLADAERAVDLGSKKGTKEARLLYNAARTYAQAARGVEAERGPGRQARDLRQQRQERAVALIRSALQALDGDVQRLQFWRDYIRRDGALAPLHYSQGFVALAAQYGRPEKGSSAPK